MANFFVIYKKFGLMTKKNLAGFIKIFLQTPSCIRLRVDRASAPEVVDPGAIPGQIKPKTIKLVFTASLLDVQQ